VTPRVAVCRKSALQAAFRFRGVGLPAVLYRPVLPRWVEDRVEGSRRESALLADGPVPRLETVEREPLADGVVIEGDDL
jgi:hypothetical protein